MISYWWPNKDHALILHLKKIGLKIPAYHSLCSNIFTSNQKCIRIFDFFDTLLFFLPQQKCLHQTSEEKKKKKKTERKQRQIKPRHGSESISHPFPTNSIQYPGRIPVLSKFPTREEIWQEPLHWRDHPIMQRRVRDLGKPNFMFFSLLPMWKQYCAFIKMCSSIPTA